MIATTEVHPEVLEAMRSAPLFQKPALQQELEIGWDSSKEYKERFVSGEARAIQNRELGLKVQISGHAGLTTLSDSVNGLATKV